LKRCFYDDWFKKEGREALILDKELTRMIVPDLSMYVRENSGPIISHP
jgi:hypothetical protein